MFMSDHKSIWGKNFTTSPGRLVFPNLAKPSGLPGQKLRYSATLVVNGDEKLQALVDEIERIGKEAFGPAWGKGGFHKPVLDGDTVVERSDGKAPASLYSGKWRIVAKLNGDKEPPAIYLRDKSKLPRRPGVETDLETIERTMYPGCYARMVVAPFTYNKLGQKGVGLTLKAVQFIQDGQRLGGENTEQMLDEEFSSDFMDAGEVLLPE